MHFQSPLSSCQRLSPVMCHTLGHWFSILFKVGVTFAFVVNTVDHAQWTTSPVFIYDCLCFASRHVLQTIPQKKRQACPHFVIVHWNRASPLKPSHSGVWQQVETVWANQVSKAWTWKEGVSFEEFPHSLSTCPKRQSFTCNHKLSHSALDLKITTWSLKKSYGVLLLGRSQMMDVLYEMLGMETCSMSQRSSSQTVRDNNKCVENKKPGYGKQLLCSRCIG